MQTSKSASAYYEDEQYKNIWGASQVATTSARLAKSIRSNDSSKLSSSFNPNRENKTEIVHSSQEAIMNSISREEIDAKLGQNKAEVDTVAAEMRREMAEFRTFQAQQFSVMNIALSDIKSQISGVNGEISGLKGHIDGLKTTSATVQWMIGAVLALLAILLAYPPIQRYIDLDQRAEITIPSPQQQPPHLAPDIKEPTESKK